MPSLNGATGLGLHRQRSKSYSPQNSICSESDFITSFSSDGSRFLDDRHDPSLNPENDFSRKVPRFSGLFSKLWMKTALCLVTALLLVSFILIGQALFAETAVSARASDLKRDNAQCPIKKWTYPNCKPLNHKNTSLSSFTPHQWYEIRRKYHQVVGDELSSLDASWRLPEEGDPSNTNNNNHPHLSGFHVPIEVRNSPGKGRGVFTTTPVKKGQVLWDNRYTARFPDECSVRQFFDLIGEDDSCNALMWAYVNDFFGDGAQFILDLDEGVYFNESPSPEDTNTVFHFRPLHDNPAYDATQQSLNTERFWQQRRIPGNYQMLASRDVEAGTELLIDYNAVHLTGRLWFFEKLCVRTRGVWDWLGMI